MGRADLAHFDFWLLIGPGNDEDAVVHMEHVDVVSVERAQDVLPDDLFCGSTRRPTRRDIDHAIHDWEQRVHFVSREQDRYVLLSRDSSQDSNHLLLTADIEIRQRLIEQEELWPTDKRVGDQDPLKFAARQGSDPRIGKALRIYGAEHFVDLAAAFA